MTGRRNGFPGLVIVLCIAIIVGSIAYVLWAKTDELKSKEQEAIQQEELLNQKLQAESERTEELEEQKKYVKTDEYIEEVAREKLGLINPNEVLFKENEGN